MLKRVFLTFAILLLTNLSALGQVDKPLIYVCFDRGFKADDPNDALIMLDGMTLTELGRIPLEGGHPEDIAVRGDKKIAFVSVDSSFDDSKGFSIVDLVEKKRIRTMLNDKVVLGVEIGPKDILYVFTAPGQLTLFDTQTFQILQTVNLPSTPKSIVFSKDEKRVFASFSGGTEVVALDLVNNFSVIKTIPVPESFGGNNKQALSPDGTLLYVTGKDSVVVIDTNRLEVIDSLPGPRNTRDLQISSDGKTLYASDFSGSLVAIDITSRSIIKTFNVAGDTRALTLSPDGQLLYANNIHNFFYIINTKTNTLIAA
ncbi:MAG: YncE family protein, partial [Acidobacteriota bacterium]